MKWRTSGCLIPAMIFGCSIWVSAQAPAPRTDATNPRRYDASYLGTEVELGPDWLFSAGDNPAYASPAYDDSGWKTVSIDRPLDTYIPKNIRFVWYRIHIAKPDLTLGISSNALAVEMQYIQGAYEVYVNGVRIGEAGMNDPGDNFQNYLDFFDIPDRAAALRGETVIALRLAANRTGPNGLPTRTPFRTDSVVLATRVAAQRDAGYVTAHETFIPFMLAGLALVVGMVALALYLAMRDRWEYLAIAVSLLGLSAQAVTVGWDHMRLFTAGRQVLETVFLCIYVIAGAEFVRLLLHLRRSHWFLALELGVVAGYFGIHPVVLGLLPITAGFAIYFVPALILNTALPVLLFRGLRQGNRDARVILPVTAVVSIANYWNFVRNSGGILHLPFHIADLPAAQIGSYGMNFWEMYWAIYDVTILLFLVLRTIGIAREGARAAAEVEAARAVQQMLVPQEVPAIPGFSLASVYRPAGEVGGDFFQIVPTSSGGALAVIGDASGKGMPAAMTVSLLVGTFRTLAHYTESPAEILAAMNTRMLARSHGGFTTCLVLRADPDGTLTIANAGHIAPYLAGMELALENGLPLGLAAESNYVESTFQLADGQQLTLVTDGVVEARDKSGALFGFERTASLSSQSAQAITQAAQAFGQEDDITALALALAGMPRPSAV